MAEQQHTKECTEAQEKWKQEVTEYEKKYPNYCKACDGYGGEATKYDPSPPGVGLSPGYMTDFCPCPECLEKDKCPQCGGNIYGEDVCPDCGWEFGQGKPEQPECYCWEIEMSKEQQQGEGY